MNATNESQLAVHQAQITLQVAAQDYVIELIKKREAVGDSDIGFVVAVDGPLFRMLDPHNNLGVTSLFGKTIVKAGLVVKAP